MCMEVEDFEVDQAGEEDRECWSSHGFCSRLVYCRKKEG